MHALHLCPQVTCWELNAQGHSRAGQPSNCKDFCSLQDSEDSCQQADATGSGTPRPLSSSRWGALVSPVTGPSLRTALSPHSSRVLWPAHRQLRLGPSKDSKTVRQPAGRVSIPVLKRSWVPSQQHGGPSEAESPSILPRPGPQSQQEM